ncbi:hypothetical protein RvY_00318 [Ramazzottius varieornatus]|uniref:Uncharacterized protein n=1 Tax=Ramazzottius varieornatus TaxID=947166 RepID=A0A1D1UMA9_RAMVA|nr:hypothetical protein RvY_00318 [Ramazzottius varieornatus]
MRSRPKSTLESLWYLCNQASNLFILFKRQELQCVMNMNAGLLERSNDGYGREQDHGQQTVAQDGYDAPNRRALPH